MVILKCYMCEVTLRLAHFAFLGARLQLTLQSGSSDRADPLGVEMAAYAQYNCTKLANANILDDY